LSIPIPAQESITLSDAADISLMTVDPGAFVYSTFGHTAIRVKDPDQRFDRCYNFGTFDFDQPNFLLKFCRGKLLYNLDVEPYRNFEYGNLQDQRPMKEQLLRLDQPQKQRIFNLLQENYKEENRYYKYDFFYDNCATRIRDVLEETFFHQLQYDTSALTKDATMRQLLRPYLVDKPWTGFGIDLVLGLPADQKALATHHMFLPDYVHDLMGKARTKTGELIIASERKIPSYSTFKDAFQPTPFDRPLWMMCLVMVLGLLSMANARADKIFDAIFWTILGLAGLVIALLWFATDHSATKWNLNILWAFPTHLLYSVTKQHTVWAKRYGMAVGGIALALLLGWVWLPQELPTAAIPLVFLVVVKTLGKQIAGLQS
jgi:hypothetical protein